MLKKFTFSTAILILLLIAFSCNKKDSTQASSTNVLASNEVIEGAKSWHSQQFQTVNTISNNAPVKFVLMPNWKESKLLRLKNGKTVLVVSSPSVYLNQKSKTGVIRKFVFEIVGSDVKDGSIIELYGSSDYVNPRKENLLESFIDNSVSDFTGSVIYYDVHYKRLSNVTFAQGKKQEAYAEILFDFGEHSKNQSSVTTLEGCTDWYLVSTYPNGYQTWVYLYTTCSDGGSELGGGGGYTPPPDLTPVTTSFSQEEILADEFGLGAPPIRYITNGTVTKVNGQITNIVLYPVTISNNHDVYIDRHGRNTTRTLTPFNQYSSATPPSGGTSSLVFWSCLVYGNWVYTDGSPTYSRQWSYSTQRVVY